MLSSGGPIIAELSHGIHCQKKIAVVILKSKIIPINSTRDSTGWFARLPSELSSAPLQE
jgi:hypothetical protein